MKNLLIYFLLFFCTRLRCQTVSAIPALIPIPESVEMRAGHFAFSPETKIVCYFENLKSDVSWFNDYLEKYYGYRLEVLSKVPDKGNYIILQIPDFEAGWKENYNLDISQDKIHILAEGRGAGFFYAFQTLLQVIPVQDAKSLKTAPFKLSCMSIKDKPRFSWRGMHLDVCRHFFPVSFIKRYLNLMSQYKLNTFHWHLTEDQGWRIEIKKYPLLTGKGAWRSGTMVGKYSDKKYDTIRYGGYYSQEEIKDIVAYASKLHITVVPEIEMPGHSQAAVAAYPWLSCNGRQLEVARGWGVFEDVYCSKDSVIHFIEDVLDEVLQLFPGKYIHIGGDECPKTRWKECRSCQARIKSENLKDEHELQSWFITRIEKYLNSKGRNIIGWDEILEGGLAPNAAVMSWRGTDGGIAAARLKHEVVMSPGKPCYFDHYQSKDKAKEPLAIGGFNPVDSVYRYEPLPKALKGDEQKYILGAQGNVWTEYIQNEKQVEYMAIPRMCALAEVLWSPKEKRNLKDFKKRLKENSKKLDRQNVNYAKHFLSR
jgi:hexosaminidase